MKTKLEIAAVNFSEAALEWQEARSAANVAEAKCDRLYDILCAEHEADERVNKGDQ